MYCKKCGTELKDGQKFCPKCGTYQTTGNESGNSETTNRDFREPPLQAPKAPINAGGPQMSIPQIIAIAIGVIAILGIIIWGVMKLPNGNLLQLFSSHEVQSSVEGIPFRSSEKGRWGMLRPDGTILFEEEFKKEHEPTIAHEGRFFVKNSHHLWEMYSVEENPEKIGDEYLYIGNFYDGVAPAVKKNEKISLIDKDGNVITYLERSGAKPITTMTNFHYGHALIEAGDAVGIVNTKGEILLEARKYCAILHVAPNRFLALDMRFKDEKEKSNLVFDIIDQEGNKKGTIRMSKYSDIKVLGDGYIAIEQNYDGEKLYGIMDINGDVILRPSRKMKGLKGYNDGKFIYSDGECLGIRTIKDKVLIRPKYDDIEWASPDMIWAFSGNDGRQEVALVDLDGNKITKESYLDALPFFDSDHAFVQITDNTWGIINDKGEELKNVPDIYAVSVQTADEIVISDYMDIDAIIAAVNMTPNGFGGFGINMNAFNLVKAYNENCKENEQRKLEPSENLQTDRLSYNKEDVIKGVNLGVELYYQGYIAERGSSHYDKKIGEWIQEPDSWTKEFPQYIKMTIYGQKMSGKTGLVYKKLVVKAKNYGQVVKENDHACIIKQKNGKGFILVDDGTKVWGMVKDIESLRNENIDQYSNKKNQRNYDYVDTDSIAEVIEDFGY